MMYLFLTTPDLYKNIYPHWKSSTQDYLLIVDKLFAQVLLFQNHRFPNLQHTTDFRTIYGTLHPYYRETI